jgi:hypothetical protein
MMETVILGGVLAHEKFEQARRPIVRERLTILHMDPHRQWESFRPRSIREGEKGKQESVV